jgi:hypothetical protein
VEAGPGCTTVAKAMKTVKTVQTMRVARPSRSQQHAMVLAERQLPTKVMHRSEFQTIAKLRVSEAQVLLDAGCFPGAYYLIGYAMECALKSCVARQIRRCEFPDKKLAIEAHTHDLEKLVRVAGLVQQFEADRRANPALELNWAITKDWSEIARYDASISEPQARDLVAACIGKGGVLPWVRKRW